MSDGAQITPDMSQEAAHRQATAMVVRLGLTPTQLRGIYESGSVAEVSDEEIMMDIISAIVTYHHETPNAEVTKIEHLDAALRVRDETTLKIIETCDRLNRERGRPPLPPSLAETRDQLRASLAS